MTIHSYKGRDITISFDGTKCVHSRNCVLNQPNVFQANTSGAWIKPDNASANDLATLAKTCPSGAISYQRHDDGSDETPPLVNTLRLHENGPLALHARITLDGEPAGMRATLCRCGQSANKPYCDSSHSKAGFVATSELASVDNQTPEKRDGEVDLAALPDGPLKFTGPVEILTGFGRRIACAQGGALCRCGASNKKPFCDGSHAKIGFRTEELLEQET
jgi:CDGSH-type Zn-finger protein/uncharacterized Fe-S cluster protein YjdI